MFRFAPPGPALAHRCDLTSLAGTPWGRWATIIAWIAGGGWSVCRPGWITRTARGNARRPTGISGTAEYAGGLPTGQPGSLGLLALVWLVTFPTSLSRSSRPSTRHAVPCAGWTPVVSNQSLGGGCVRLPAAPGAMIAGRAPLALWWRQPGGAAARAVVGCWDSSHRRSDHAEYARLLRPDPPSVSDAGVVLCACLVEEVVAGRLRGIASRGSVKSKVRVSS